MNNVPGTVYLLHFCEPYQHARHYVGWASNLDARLAQHAAGNGARLTEVIRDAGIGFTLARTMPGTRSDERRVHNAGGMARYCPICSARPRDGVWAPLGGNP